MNSTNKTDSGLEVGTLVRIRAEYCDRPEESEFRFRVVENNGDRLTIELVTDARLAPTELVRPNMIEAVR